MADTFTFNYNPFQVAERDRFLPMGDQTSNFQPLWGNDKEQYWTLGDSLPQNNPDLYNNWLNTSNFQLMPYEEGQPAQFRVKTGDKEGTLYTLLPDGSGGYVAAPEGASRWDTNDQLRQWGPFLPLLAMGGASLASGLSGTGFGGSGLAEGAASAAAGGSSAPASSGGFIENLLGQSTASGGSLGAAQTAAPGFMAGAAATSPAPMSLIPFTGASTSALLGGAGLTGAGYQLAQTAAEQAANAAPSVGPSQPSVGPSQQPSASTPGKTINVPGIGDVPLDWLKLGGGLLGGLASYLDAKSQNGKPQGYEPSLNRLSSLLGAPQYQPTFTTQLPGGSGPQFTTSLPNLSGLQGKRYY